MSDEAITESAPIETSEPAPAPVADVGGDWRDNLDDDAKGYLETKGWESPDNVLTGYRELEKAWGDPNKIVMPAEGAAPEDVDQFFQKIGKPAEAKDYNLVAPENYEAYSTDLADTFRGKAHELHLTGSQAQGVHDWFVENQMSSQQEFAEQTTQKFNEQDAAVRKEFGANFDNQMKMARVGAEKFGDAEFVEMLTENNLINHPSFVRVFGNIGRAVSDPDASGTGLGQGVEPSLSAEAQVQKLMQDEAFMKKYMGREEIGHEEAVKRMDDLHLKIAEEKEQAA